MNVTAIIFTVLAVLAAVASMVLLGQFQPAQLGDAAFYGASATWQTPWQSAFANFKGLFDFKAMFDYSSNVSYIQSIDAKSSINNWWIILPCLLGVLFIIILIQFILMIKHKKPAAIISGVFFILAFLIAYLEIAETMLPVTADGKYSGEAISFYFGQKNSFVNCIAAGQDGGYADSLQEAQKMWLWLPTAVAGGSLILAFIGGCFSLSYAGKPKAKPAEKKEEAKPASAAPVQCEPIIVVPTRGPAAPVGQGPIVQFIQNEGDPSDASSQPVIQNGPLGVTKDEVRQTLKDELDVATGKKKPEEIKEEPAAPAAQVTTHSEEYATKDDVKEAVDEVLDEVTKKK
jgi:hypothetical protein